MDADAEKIKHAFDQYDREVAISNIKIGCILGIILVPSFAFLDYAVYHDMAPVFLRLRLICSLLIGVFFSVLLTPFGRRYYRIIGVTLVLLPASCVSFMIYFAPDGASSPYYAGLNLTLLVLGFVLRWTLRESLVAVFLVWLEYLIACLFHGNLVLNGVVINNLYFLICTGIIVVVGNYTFSNFRYREFALRYELDENRKALISSLTQLKENEAQLVHSEKLASLGRMSAGMIHEINNPLNFVTTALFTLRKQAENLSPGQRQDYLDTLRDVEEGVGRVKTIVSDLRVFTRQDNEQYDEVPVAEVATAALRFLHIENKDQVLFERAFPPNLTVWMNKNKLIHILANLLQNSLDALKNKTFTDEMPTIRIEGHLENGASILSVRDNGPGIPAEHLNKIFDPFFTTKDVGAGMGLGLSICYRLVEEAQGKIAVNTKLGQYCEFVMAFPARKKQTTAG
jgi:two-component system, sensor histidine kinase PhcS